MELHATTEAPPQPKADGPVTPEHANPEHVKAVFGWLVGLTVIEVGFVYLHLPRKVLATLLIGSSVAKAALVAMFFVHLKFEARLVHSLAILPVLMALLFLAALFPDIVIGYWPQ